MHMSLIIHRCAVCAHPDIYHDGDRARSCCWTQCHIGPHVMLPAPSELLTTYTPDGAAVARIEPPGTAFRGFGRGTVDLCGCANCEALYASVTGGAA
jgi:hypothetical protein